LAYDQLHTFREPSIKSNQATRGRNRLVSAAKANRALAPIQALEDGGATLFMRGWRDDGYVAFPASGRSNMLGKSN
jgi:hypothetical protein